MQFLTRVPAIAIHGFHHIGQADQRGGFKLRQEIEIGETDFSSHLSNELEEKLAKFISQI
jgi:hypothetical protein